MKLDLTAGSVRERVGSQAHPAQGTERCDTGRSIYPWLSWADARVSSLSPQLYSFCRMSITLPSAAHPSLVRGRVLGGLALFAVSQFGSISTASAQGNAPQPTSPQELHQALVATFNAGDIDALVSLYENESALVPEPGRAVNGKQKVRDALKGFLAIKGKIQIDTVYVVQAGDVALTRSSWSIRDGEDVKVAKEGTEILRRQPNGNWLFLIDHPYGAEPKSAK